MLNPVNIRSETKAAVSKKPSQHSVVAPLAETVSNRSEPKQSAIQQKPPTPVQQRSSQHSSIINPIQIAQPDPALMNRLSLIEQQMQKMSQQVAQLSAAPRKSTPTPVTKPDGVQHLDAQPQATSTIKINTAQDSNVQKLKIFTEPSTGLNNQIQETFRETMEIISSLKEEIDLIGEQTKIKLEHNNRQIEQSADIVTRKLMLEIEPLQNDMTLVKEKEAQLNREVEHAIGRQNSKIADDMEKLDQEIIRLTESLGGDALRNQVSILEQEIIDVKNMYRIPLQRGQNQRLEREDVEQITEELNEIWTFVQRYVDEQAVNMVQELRNSDTTLKTKMNLMDWLARNSEFLSPEAITKCLMAYKELYNFENLAQRNTYIKAKTNSEAIITVSNLINHANKLQRGDETNSRLAILLSIYEPLLINDYNLERALQPKYRIVEVLSGIVKMPQNLKRAFLEVEEDDPRTKVPVHLKYAIRCLTSCMRSNNGVTTFVSSQSAVGQVLEFLEFTKDEEIQANCAKILRISLRDESHYGLITDNHSDIGNLLLKNVNSFMFSDVVLMELLAALRNLSRSPPKISFIQTANVNVLIKIAKVPPSEKIQQVALQCLNNMTASPQLDKHIQTMGGSDIYQLLKGDQNRFNFQ